MLEILCIATAALAIASLVVAILSFNNRIDQVQAARERAAFDTCGLLRILILRSGQVSHHQAQARAFLGAVGLSNCHTYAIHVKQGTSP